VSDHNRAPISAKQKDQDRITRAIILEHDLTRIDVAFGKANAGQLVDTNP